MTKPSLLRRHIFKMTNAGLLEHVKSLIPEHSVVTFTQTLVDSSSNSLPAGKAALPGNADMRWAAESGLVGKIYNKVKLSISRASRAPETRPVGTFQEFMSVRMGAKDGKSRGISGGKDNDDNDDGKDSRHGKEKDPSALLSDGSLSAPLSSNYLLLLYLSYPSLPSIVRRDILLVASAMSGPPYEADKTDGASAILSELIESHGSKPQPIDEFSYILSQMARGVSGVCEETAKEIMDKLKLNQLEGADKNSKKEGESGESSDDRKGQESALSLHPLGVRAKWGSGVGDMVWLQEWESESEPMRSGIIVREEAHKEGGILTMDDILGGERKSSEAATVAGDSIEMKAKVKGTPRGNVSGVNVGPRAGVLQAAPTDAKASVPSGSARKAAPIASGTMKNPRLLVRPTGGAQSSSASSMSSISIPTTKKPSFMASSGTLKAQSTTRGLAAPPRLKSSSSKKRKGMMMMEESEVKLKVTGMIEKEDTEQVAASKKRKLAQDERKRVKREKLEEKEAMKKKAKEARAAKATAKSKSTKVAAAVETVKKESKEEDGNEGNDDGKGDDSGKSESQTQTDKAVPSRPAGEASGDLGVNVDAGKNMPEEYYKLLERSNSLSDSNSLVLMEFFNRNSEGQDDKTNREDARLKMHEERLQKEDGNMQKITDYVELFWGTGKFKLIRKTKKLSS